MAVKTIRMTLDKPETELYVTNITSHIDKEIEKSGISDGSITVFAPGSTAGITTIEYEPNLLKDLNTMLETITPSDIQYAHNKTWGESNGKSHLRASIFGPSITIPFVEGKMILGKWQQLVVLDFDVVVRKRDLVIQIIN